MTREQFEHVIRTAASVTKEQSFMLLREGVISLPALIERIGRLDAQAHPVATIQAWARRRAQALQP